MSETKIYGNDLKQIKENTVICGDSFNVLECLPDNFFQLLLTDIPYNISQDNNFHTMRSHRRGLDFGEWDKGFDTTGWLPAAVKTLVKGGSIVVFCSFRQLGPLASALEELGMNVKTPIHLVKKNPVPRNIDRRFVSCVEYALWAVKPGGKWIFNRREDKKFETGIFYYGTQKNAHPTKKPNGLFEELITILSNPGDWILDPFAGSGTAGIAAAALGRKFVLVEKDEKYWKMCLENTIEANG